MDDPRSREDHWDFNNIVQLNLLLDFEHYVSSQIRVVRKGRNFRELLIMGWYLEVYP